MAKTTSPDTVIIIDDEIHNMLWMADYIESLGMNVITASNVNDAILLLSTEIYRAVIIDLNIPALPPVDKSVTMKGIIYGQYPGLYVANFARNKGYRGKQIMIYSVHRDNSVSDELIKLSCSYVIKGRPMDIKSELDEVLKYDPTL